MKRFWFKKGLLFVMLFIIAILLTGFVVMSLWNAILPGIIGVHPISFLQALGILILCRILFGSFGGRRGWRGMRDQNWKKNMQEKLAAMTPEEREKFKREWRNRCVGRRQYSANDNSTAGSMSPES